MRDAIRSSPDSLGARASDPETKIELVTATHTVDELIGRQLIAQTQHAGAPEDLTSSPLSNVVAFIPTIAVRGVDLPAPRAHVVHHEGPDG